MPKYVESIALLCSQQVCMSQFIVGIHEVWEIHDLWTIIVLYICIHPLDREMLVVQQLAFSLTNLSLIWSYLHGCLT